MRSNPEGPLLDLSPRRIRGFALLLLALAPVHARAAAGSEQEARADSLVRLANQLFDQATPEARQTAFRHFDDAIHLAPDRADLWMAFGHACERTGRFERARSCFEQAAHHAPDDPVAWMGLGEAWKNDWLRTLDRESLDHARDAYTRATVLDSASVPALWAVSSVALLRGQPRPALQAALRANQLDPRAPKPMLALGAALFRLGALSLADSAFRGARAHVSGALARRFDEPMAVLDSATSLPEPLAGSEFVWSDSDPDLTTPENEARLDYLTRLALACFLFAEGPKLRWDLRAELFVRYGPPAGVEFNPAWAQLGWGNDLEFHYAPSAARQFYAPRGGTGFPYDMQLWHYPELGMDVVLWDRFLNRTYDLPYSNRRELDPRPDPAALAARSDLVVLGGGRGVFRAMPPGAHPFPVSAWLARFPSERAMRVFGQVFAGVPPSDSLHAAWAVVDSAGRVLARAEAPLGLSGCDPAGRQVADFAVEVAPGDYRVDLAVWDKQGRRGVTHLRTRVGEPQSGLALSDLILLCDGSPRRVEASAVHVESNLDARVAGDLLTLYYEIEHLAPDAGGKARFAYRSTVFAIDPKRDRRAAGAALIDVTREEENVGPHRRQFVTVPIRELRPGSYELKVTVTDRASGETAERSLRFHRG